MLAKGKSVSGGVVIMFNNHTQPNATIRNHTQPYRAITGAVGFKRWAGVQGLGCGQGWQEGGNWKPLPNATKPNQTHWGLAMWAGLGSVRRRDVGGLAGVKR